MIQTRKFIYSFLFSGFLIQGAFAYTESIHQEASFMTGMAAVSYTETEAELDGETELEAAESGGISVITGKVHYKFFPYLKSAYHVDLHFPLLLSTGGNSYFHTGLGWEYYFTDVAHKVSIDHQGKTINLVPNFRAFVGAEVGISYFAYTTETKIKNDTVFEIGPIMGAVYKVSKKWSLRGDFGYMRGIGISTSTFAMKISVGGTIFLGD